jgi:hypothetical protein
LQAAVAAPIVTTSQATISLESQRKFYRAKRGLALRLGLSLDWFVGEFGSEEAWMGQFTAQAYDNEVMQL